MVGELSLIFYQESDSCHFGSTPLPCPINALHAVSCVSVLVHTVPLIQKALLSFLSFTHIYQP